MDTKALEGLGLTPNEATVYVVLLELGRAHAGEIAEQTRMHRRTIYDCLERLAERGLVGHVMEGKTRYFKASDPKKLLATAEEKAREIADVLPSLLRMAASGKKGAEVSVHRGKEGLKLVMDDVVWTKPKIWYSLTSSGKGTEVIPAPINKFHRARIRRGIPLKIIFGKRKEALARASELAKMSLTQLRYLDARYMVPVSLWVYGDKVALLLWDSETGIVIEDAATARTFENYFNALWKTSSVRP